MTKLTAIVIVIFLVVLALGGIFAKKYFSLLAEREQLTQSVNISKDSTIHFKAKSGLLAAQVDQQQYTLQQMKEMNLSQLDEVKSAVKDLKIEMKNVRSYTGTNISTVKNFFARVKDTLIYHHDTTHAEVFHYDNKWWHIKGLRITNKDSTWDSISIKSFDSLEFVGSIHRTWFLGKTHITGTATSKNPDTQIIGIKFMDIKPTHKFLFWEW